MSLFARFPLFLACLVASALSLQVEFVPLNHTYSDYEPFVDTDTMRIHHSGHFKAYTDNLNAALSEAEKYAPELGNMSLVDVLKNIDSLKLPANVSIAILNNGGGYLNHILFFNQLRASHAAGDESTRLQASSYLAALLSKTFGSPSIFEKMLAETCMKVFGSGWCWLELCGSRAAVTWQPNQATPVQRNCTPLLGIDVWEHAYYLKHANKRAPYVANMLLIINWGVVDRLFTTALKEMPTNVRDEILDHIHMPNEL